jgi:hypothetical protein
VEGRRFDPAPGHRHEKPQPDGLRLLALRRPYPATVPFTLSHPAAVVLLRGTGLPVAAMVVGSMAPDVPMFVRIPGAYAVTHSWWGVVTVDVALSVIGLLVWFGLVRDALVDLSPGAVRSRLHPRARYSSRQWSLVPLAVVLGSASHVAWDDFTHRGRWGVRQIGWLHETHGALFGFKWAQYASGVIGLLVVAIWAIAALRRLEPRPRGVGVTALGTRTLVAVLVTTAVVTFAAALSRESHGLVPMAFRGAVWGTVTLTVGLLILATAWRVLARGLRLESSAW